MLQELKEDILDQVVADNAKVVVQYSAGWCGNCRIMKPKFKKMAAENDAMTFVWIDAEKNPNSRQLADVSNLPLLHISTMVSWLGKFKPTKPMC